MGADKALLHFGGQSLVERAVAVLGQLEIPVRLVVNRHQRIVAANCPVLIDEVDDAGPLGGLLTALRRSSSELNYILACDLPLAPARLFRILETHAQSCEAIVPADRAERLHPLCALYRRSCLPEVERRIRNRQLRMDRLVASSAVQTRIVTAHEHGLPDRIFCNVNSPADFEALNESLRPAGSDNQS